MLDALFSHKGCLENHSAEADSESSESNIDEIYKTLLPTIWSQAPLAFRRQPSQSMDTSMEIHDHYQQIRAVHPVSIGQDERERHKAEALSLLECDRRNMLSCSPPSLLSPPSSTSSLDVEESVEAEVNLQPYL